MSRHTEPTLWRYFNLPGAGDVELISESFAKAATWNVKADVPTAGPWHGRNEIADGFLAEVMGEHLQNQR